MKAKKKQKRQHLADHLNDKAFVTLLSDAVEHAYLATAIEGPGSVARLARSSIVSSALSVESVANICLALLPLSGTFAEDVEKKFGSFEKFELFLALHKGAGVFERDCDAVQKIQDLINLRNDFVHPKSLRLPVQDCWETNGTRHATIDAGTYNHLQLSRSYRTWNGDAAVAVVRAVFEFFDRFFFQWCQWEPERTAAILSPELVANGSSTIVGIPGEIELFEKANKLWNVPIRWIKFGIVPAVANE